MGDRKQTSTVAIDFDGVLHRHVAPWTCTSEVNDVPTPGALDAVKAYLKAGLRIIVFSARATDNDGRRAIGAWLKKHGFPRLNITHEKPHADLYIDDRGYHFTGTWPSVEYIRDFQPWNKQVLPEEDAVIKLEDASLAAFDVQRELAHIHSSIIAGLQVPAELLRDEEHPLHAHERASKEKHMQVFFDMINSEVSHGKYLWVLPMQHHPLLEGCAMKIDTYYRALSVAHSGVRVHLNDQCSVLLHWEQVEAISWRG